MIAHSDHLFFSPIEAARLDRLLGLLDLEESSRVLDVGCGNGEMLLRTMERWGAYGVGIDPNPGAIDLARTAARGRVPDDRLELLEIAAADFDAGPSLFDAALCIGSTHAFGGYRSTLESLGRLLRPGGLMLVGEGYWRREPDPDYLVAFSSTRDEFTDHAGNVAVAVELGLVPLYSTTSNQDEWDHYEGLYCRAVERFAAEHPDDPDHDAMLERIRKWRDTYLRWGRDTLGFGYYLFRCRDRRSADLPIE